MTAKRLIKIGKRIRVHSRSFVAKNIFLKAIFSILDPRSSILDPLRFLRFFVAGLLALLLCVGPLFFQRSLSSAEAQTLRERHARLRAALDRNDQAEAESLLGGMLANNPEAFALNNYDYLLARLLQNRQAGDEAATFFLRVVNRNSPLADYALWHLAEIARARGDYPEEQKLLRKFVAQRGDHPLRERAIERLGDSYFKTGQYQNAIDTMQLP